MAIALFGSFHISNNNRTKQERKAYNVDDVQGWIKHNHRLIDFNQHQKNKSLIDFKLSKFNNLFFNHDFENFKDPENFKNWINSLIDSKEIDQYNQKQKKKSRRVKDFYSFLTKDKTRSIADQFVVSLGSSESFKNIDPNFWTNQGRSWWLNYQKDLNEFLKLNLPNFEIYSSTLHLDETTPHIHIIGANLVERKNKKYGLSKQVINSELIKSNGLSDLSELHDRFRSFNQIKTKSLNHFLNFHNIQTNFYVPNETKQEQLADRFVSNNLKNFVLEIENQGLKPFNKMDLLELKKYISEKLKQEPEQQNQKDLEKELLKTIIDIYLKKTSGVYYDPNLAWLKERLTQLNNDPINLINRLQIEKAQFEHQNHQNPTNKKGFGF